MSGWIPMLMGFAAGSPLGSTWARLRSKAKLRLHKQFIEARLSSVNLPHGSAPLAGIRWAGSFTGTFPLMAYGLMGSPGSENFISP